MQKYRLYEGRQKTKTKSEYKIFSTYGKMPENGVKYKCKIIGG